jgi:hypothetical protein
LILICNIVPLGTLLWLQRSILRTRRRNEQLSKNDLKLIRTNW